MTTQYLHTDGYFYTFEEDAPSIDLPKIAIECLNAKHEASFRSVDFFAQGGVIKCIDVDALDYYGEFRGEYSWIHPALEAWAAKRGTYWEWDNCECISLCKI